MVWRSLQKPSNESDSHGRAIVDYWRDMLIWLDLLGVSKKSISIGEIEGIIV
jgi:hypothetical protein